MFFEKWANGSRFEGMGENSLRECKIDDVGNRK
jgi:hypothetical protein